MNIEEAIKLLKQEPDFSLSYYKREYAIDLLLKDYEKLKDEYKREVFEHQEFVEDTKVAVQDYIKKDKIKEKIKECNSILYSMEEEERMLKGKADKGSVNSLLAQISILNSLLGE